MYDNVCKFLAENYSRDFAQWLLGEPLYLEALDLRKQLLGDNHPDVATSLNNLAALYDSQGRYIGSRECCLILP